MIDFSKRPAIAIAVFSLLLLNIACEKNRPYRLPSITITAIAQPEGNNGTGLFHFTLWLNKKSGVPVTITWSTTEGTAKNGEDFTAVINRTDTLQPGETRKLITVYLVGDDIKETHETFGLKLTGATNAVIQHQSMDGEIINDDTRVPFTNAGYEAPSGYAGYSLVWADEFSGASLNDAVWNRHEGDGCPGGCGWGDNELQYYTRSIDNAFLQDGKLIIEAKKESFGGKSYTSARISTASNKMFKFGRIDIRARLPKGKGTAAAFGMQPQIYDWPTTTAMDLLRLAGHQANKAYGTIYYGVANTQISRIYTLSAGTFNDEFHVFSLEWKQDQLKWYIDNNLYSTVNKADLGATAYPFNQSFYFVINLAVGGDWPDKLGIPDEGADLLQWLIVDYIRVYQ